MQQENVDVGRSFGAAAELYDRLRYTPSDQVLAWLLSGQEGGQVLDLASGTGQIARRLTDDFIGQDGAVFALEPDPRMRRVLRARVPRATVIDGTAESIPLATASIDTVLAGSACPRRPLPRRVHDRAGDPDSLLAGEADPARRRLLKRR